METRFPTVHKCLSCPCHRMNFGSSSFCTAVFSHRCKMASVSPRPGNWQLCSVCFTYAACRGCPCRAGYRYCSRSCQITHWYNEHRDDCQVKAATDTLRGLGMARNLASIILSYAFRLPREGNITDQTDQTDQSR